MTKTIYLVPAKGVKVRNPQGGYLAEVGDTVVLDSYWRRRLADNSVTEGKAPSAKKDAKE